MYVLYALFQFVLAFQSTCRGPQSTTATVQTVCLDFDIHRFCGDPAIYLLSHHVSLVQWTTCLLPITKYPGSNPLGEYLCETGILLLALSRYIGDHDVIDNHGLV
jgi:hypothetical protein